MGKIESVISISLEPSIKKKELQHFSKDILSIKYR